MTLIYWEWHLIPSWLLRSIIARFPEQLLKDLISWGSPGEYCMLNFFLWDASEVLSCPFWSTILQCGARLYIDTHLKLLERVVSGARVLTGGVFECDISQRRYVAALRMLYKITCNQMHPLDGALLVPYLPIFGLIGSNSLSPSLALSNFLIIIIIIIIIK